MYPSGRVDQFGATLGLPTKAPQKLSERNLELIRDLNKKPLEAEIPSSGPAMFLLQSNGNAFSVPLKFTIEKTHKIALGTLMETHEYQCLIDREPSDPLQSHLQVFTTGFHHISEIETTTGTAYYLPKPEEIEEMRKRVHDIYDKTFHLGDAKKYSEQLEELRKEGQLNLSYYAVERLIQVAEDSEFVTDESQGSSSALSPLAKKISSLLSHDSFAQDFGLNSISMDSINATRAKKTMAPSQTIFFSDL